MIRAPTSALNCVNSYPAGGPTGRVRRVGSSIPMRLKRNRIPRGRPATKKSTFTYLRERRDGSVASALRIRPRRGAANLFPQAPFEGSVATSPYTPCVPSKLAEAPRALPYPAHKGVAGAERSQRRRNSVKPSFLDTGQVALCHLRCIVAGEVSG